MRLYRPATVVIGVVFVLLGGIVRLGLPSEVFDDPTKVVTHATVGEEVEYRGSQLTVTRVKFVKSFLPRETENKAVQTKGVFVAVEYDAVRGAGEPPRSEVTLTADGGSVYVPVAETIGTSVDFPPPGFARSGAFVFEVNPADVVGLTLVVETQQIFNSLAQDLAIDLAVPSEDVAQRMIETATDEYVLPKPTIRVAE